MQRTKGFTLIEIAIVLVIIGLLLGGVLKGQELITGARVRNLISQQDGIKAAFYGFQDRYRGLPGDYAAASTNINCTGGCPDGNGNGRIEATVPSQREDIYAWTHLTAAGFINGSYSALSGVSSQDTTNTPNNPYSQLVGLMYDGCYGNFADCTSATSPQKHNLKTGSQVPSEILAEVDRKIDDGKPASGAFQFSPWVANGASGGPVNTQCVLIVSSVAVWAITAPQTNCGGASLF
jgi:prepilin-type N-terminal cleavage/methylation domain-containing protein